MIFLRRNILIPQKMESVIPSKRNYKTPSGYWADKFKNHKRVAPFFHIHNPYKALNLLTVSIRENNRINSTINFSGYYIEYKPVTALSWVDGSSNSFMEKNKFLFVSAKNELYNRPPLESDFQTLVASCAKHNGSRSFSEEIHTLYAETYKLVEVVPTKYTSKMHLTPYLERRVDPMLFSLEKQAPFPREYADITWHPSFKEAVNTFADSLDSSCPEIFEYVGLLIKFAQTNEILTLFCCVQLLCSLIGIKSVYSLYHSLFVKGAFTTFLVHVYKALIKKILVVDYSYIKAAKDTVFNYFAKTMSFASQHIFSVATISAGIGFIAWIVKNPPLDPGAFPPLF